MKSFEYLAPTSISEAVALLNDKGKRARIFAGGTDLLVQLRLKLIDLDLMVDVKQIPELNRLSFDPAEGLTVGAAITCAQFCKEPDMLERYPGLVDSASIIGDASIQEKATLGGNLCNAAPSSDIIPAMIVLGACCTVAGPQGTRAVPAEQFCLAPGKTVLKRNELLVSIHFPAPKPNSGSCYLRFTPGHETDLAFVGVSAWAALNDNQTRITEARIALAAVAPTPLLIDLSGTPLIGQMPSEATFAEAAKIAQKAARPTTDVLGTTAQRRQVVGVLVKHALHDAVYRAKGKLVKTQDDMYPSYL